MTFGFTPELKCKLAFRQRLGDLGLGILLFLSSTMLSIAQQEAANTEVLNFPDDAVPHA